MNIAFVSTIFSFPLGGADTLWIAAAEAAVQRGDSVLIAVSRLVRNHPRVLSLERAGARVLQRDDNHVPRPLPRRIAHRIGARFRGDPLIRALGRAKPDLIIVSCGGTYDLLNEPALVDWHQVTGVPLRVIANFQVENPILSEPDRLKITAVFERLDRLFFVSTRNLDSTRRHLLRPLPRATVVHNPLRCLPGQPLAWPDTDEFRFATVARLDPRKGISLLLHALAHVLADQAGWTLDIFGEGPDEPNLRMTIDALGLHRRVALRGYVGLLPKIWSTHHLLFCPSLEDGVPMTIPEAMLLGRTVLATAVGGAEDWVRHGTTGYICAAPTLPLLEQSIASAWTDRNQWSQLAARGADDAAATYRPRDYERLIAVR